MPALGTVGDRLVRAGKMQGMESLKRADEAVAEGDSEKRLAATEYALNTDATVIEAEKNEAR